MASFLTVTCSWMLLLSMPMQNTILFPKMVTRVCVCIYIYLVEMAGWDFVLWWARLCWSGAQTAHFVNVRLVTQGHRRIRSEQKSCRVKEGQRGIELHRVKSSRMLTGLYLSFPFSLCSSCRNFGGWFLGTRSRKTCLKVVVVAL